VHLSTDRLFWSACFLALLALPATVPGPGLAVAQAQAPPDVGCYACLVRDDTGTTLWARRASAPLPNASTTKMLTALVASSRLDLHAEIEVSSTAAAVPGGKLSLEAGERWSTQELLYGLLLGSSNDAAVALAEATAGSEPAFVDLMKAEAQRLGALDTGIVTSHGLDASGHVSTAHDLATIAVEFLEHPLLARIVASTSVTLTSSHRTIVVPNSNQLIGSYEGAIGIKTGFTSDAGNVLVAAARRHRRTVVVVTMRAADTFEDARRMLDYAFKRLGRGILLKAMTSVGDMVFDSGSTGAVASTDVRGITRPSEVTIEFEPDPFVAAPIATGDRVGNVVVRAGNGRVVGSSPALATRAVEERRAGVGLSSGFARILALFGPLLGEG